MSEQSVSSLVHVLNRIAEAFGAEFANECSAALIMFKKQTPHSKIRFYERDELPRLECNGITIWLNFEKTCQQDDPPEGPHLFIIERCFFRKSAGRETIIYTNSPARALEAVEDLKSQFFNAPIVKMKEFSLSTA